MMVIWIIERFLCLPILSAFSPLFERFYDACSLLQLGASIKNLSLRIKFTYDSSQGHVSFELHPSLIMEDMIFEDDLDNVDGEDINLEDLLQDVQMQMEQVSTKNDGHILSSLLRMSRQ